MSWNGDDVCTTCDGSGWEVCENGQLCQEHHCDGLYHLCPSCLGTGAGDTPIVL